MIYRISTLAELRDCYHLFRAFNEESGYRCPFDERAVEERLWPLMQGNICAFFAILDPIQERFVGIVGVIAGPDLFSHEIKSDELLWFIDPKHRGGSFALRLFDAAEKWCLEREAVRLGMTALCNDDQPKVARFYERKGYMPCETKYLKTLN